MAEVESARQKRLRGLMIFASVTLGGIRTPAVDRVTTSVLALHHSDHSSVGFWLSSTLGVVS